MSSCTKHRLDDQYTVGKEFALAFDNHRSCRASNKLPCRGARHWVPHMLPAESAHRRTGLLCLVSDTLPANVAHTECTSANDILQQHWTPYLSQTCGWL